MSCKLEEKLEEKLAAEIDFRTFLEDEILELELLDEQEDEIGDLDKLVAKYK